MMDELIANFTNQLKDALEIGRSARLTPRHKDIRNVVVAGMGGSGIGGNLVSSLIAEKIKLPIIISKDYFLPEFVNEHTLLIANSYSGNTEETMHALEEGIRRNCKIVCISSGGSMLSVAKLAGDRQHHHTCRYATACFPRLFVHSAALCSVVPQSN